MRIELQGITREQRAKELAEILAEGCHENVADALPSEFIGGRRAALEALHHFDVRKYAQQRNYESERRAVSRLSPYIRHGMLGLREVAQFVKERFGKSPDTLKFWQELGWRQFWQEIYRRHGEAIYSDMEAAKVDLGSREDAGDIVEARTGLACMDGFVRELLRNGYLHNHARMWFASYWVHFRKLSWRVGADFFLRHLVDGDPASNHLSWQWVASTFSHKPYIFNRENLERYTSGKYCRECRAKCPFDESYDTLEKKLFTGDQDHAGGRPENMVAAGDAGSATVGSTVVGSEDVVVWLHGDSLSVADPALLAYPHTERFFVFDQEYLRAFRPSIKRLLFLYEAAIEAGAVVYYGVPTEMIVDRCRERSCGTVAVTESVSPRFAMYEKSLRQAGLEVSLHHAEELVNVPRHEPVRRFTAFWKRYGLEWS